MAKWSFKRLMTAWEDLRIRSGDREDFKRRWDELVIESGWDKIEFYKAIDDHNRMLYSG